MVALSRCLGSLTFALLGAEGARVSRKRAASTTAAATKFIAGVPVLNYDIAYSGESSLGQLESQKEQEWVVVVNPGTSDEQIQAMCKTSKNACNLVGSPQNGGVPFLEMRGTETDLEAVILDSHGAVSFVEPDQTLHMIPEIETEDVESATWGLNRIGADQRGRAGAGATIFILDTGVRVSHRDFGGRAAPALDLTVGPPKQCYGDLTCAGDAQGHCTHCAGSAAGDSFGVAPQAAVRSIKVLGDDGSGSLSWSYKALDWLASLETRPAVASMSLGATGTQPSMKNAVDAAVNSGVTVVVAGGNSNANACNFSPAFVPSAITVGSTDSNDDRSYFSNYGACTNIWAPGSSIVSASHTSDTGSKSLSGTSMACPHVAGGAALILQANPRMKASAVLSKLQDDAVSDIVSGLTNKDVNKLLWVSAASAPPTPPTPAPPPTPPPPMCPRWAVQEEPDVHGDCQCKNGLFCSLDGVNRNCPSSVGPGGWGGEYWLPTCTKCRCFYDWTGR